jgi:hypothetical protein
VVGREDEEDEEEGRADMDRDLVPKPLEDLQSCNGILLLIQNHRCRNGRREHQFGRDILPQRPRELGYFLPALITFLIPLLFPFSLRPEF